MRDLTATEACCALTSALEAHDAVAIREATASCQHVAYEFNKAALRSLEVREHLKITPDTPDGHQDQDTKDTLDRIISRFQQGHGIKEAKNEDARDTSLRADQRAVHKSPLD